MNIKLEILFLILGAILGAVVPVIYTNVINFYLNTSRTTRQKMLESGNSYDWLIEYYKRRGGLNDLFDCRIGKLEIKIPFLTKKKWNEYKNNLLDGEDFLNYSETLNQDFPVDKKLIRKRTLLKQRLFNEPTLYLDRLDENEKSIELHIKKCSYFQMFTLLASLEEETFKAIRSNTFSNTPIRDTTCANTITAQQIHARPSSIGCQVAIALRVKTGYEIIIQTRSHSTITYGGAKALIPVFGLSPIVGESAYSNILFYNFIKEYCEELFDYEELITLMTTNRVDPYWFYNLPEAQEIFGLIERKLLALEYLGFGFDALNGSSTIALLAVIDDVEYSKNIKKKISTNWEVAQRSFDTMPLEFIDYKSPKLEEWLQRKEYHFGSAFTLARALEELDNRLQKNNDPALREQVI